MAELNTMERVGISHELRPSDELRFFVHLAFNLLLLHLGSLL